MVPLQRPADLGDKRTLTDEEVAERFHNTSSRLFPQDHADPGRQGASYNEFWFEWGEDTNRTSLIVDPADGRLPPLTPTAAASLAEDPFSYGGSAGLDSWDGVSLFERCITRGMPGAMIPGFYNHNYQILQTPHTVVILYEILHDARVIPLDDTPRPPTNVRQWLGVPRGRWDGETLVVETTHFSDTSNQRGPGGNSGGAMIFTDFSASEHTHLIERSNQRGPGGNSGGAMIFTDFSASEHTHLIERCTRVSSDRIAYQFTLDDPTEFTRPFTAEIPMRRIDGAIYEYACQEGNYALANMLRSARAAERASEP